MLHTGVGTLNGHILCVRDMLFPFPMKIYSNSSTITFKKNHCSCSLRTNFNSYINRHIPRTASTVGNGREVKETYPEARREERCIKCENGREKHGLTEQGDLQQGRRLALETENLGVCLQ